MALRRAGAASAEPICTACLLIAAQSGSGTAERLFLALADLQTASAAPPPDEPCPAACPACGMDLSEMLDAAMAGCPECYRHFGHILIPRPARTGSRVGA